MGLTQQVQVTSEGEVCRDAVEGDGAVVDGERLRLIERETGRPRDCEVQDERGPAGSVWSAPIDIARENARLTPRP